MTSYNWVEGLDSMKKKKGKIDRSETFDEFLAKDGILAETEDAALKEIIANKVKVAMSRHSN